MTTRKHSAKERTGLFLLAATLAGLGGTTIAAEHHKTPLAEPKKKGVAILGTAKKQTPGTRKKRTGKHQKISAGGQDVLASLGAGLHLDELFKREAPRPAAPVAPDKASASAPVAPYTGGDLPIGQEDPYRKNMPEDYTPSDLVDMSSDVSYSPGKKIRLRKEAAESLQKMIDDAAKEGLTLKVVSAHRDVAYQRKLYQNAVRRYGKGQIMVGKPGRSEHFLGTTVDVSNRNPAHLLQRAFGNSAEYKWLEANADKYGWKFTVRTGIKGRTKSQDEPWHIRYMGTPATAPTTEVPATAVAEAAGTKIPADEGLSLLQRLAQFFGQEKTAPETARTVTTAAAKGTPPKVAGGS